MLSRGRSAPRSPRTCCRFEGVWESKLINSYGLAEIHQARLCVERQVVGDAAEQIDDETLRQLDESLTAQRTSLDDPVRFLIIDREFHLAIYRSCGNRVLADFVGNLYGYMMAHRRKAVSEPGAISRSYGDHVAIVGALKSRRRKAAVQAMEAHLNRIYETTLMILERPDAKPGVVGRPGTRSYGGSPPASHDE